MSASAAFPSRDRCVHLGMPAIAPDDEIIELHDVDGPIWRVSAHWLAQPGLQLFTSWPPDSIGSTHV
jgi:hypothetical protein